MKIKNCKLKIISLTILATCYFLPITKVSAANFDLSVSPSIFQIELTPPAVANVKQTLTLENNSEEPLNLRLTYRPFKPAGEDGNLTYLKEGDSPGNDPQIFDRISVLDNGQPLESFTIPPKTKKDYDLAISIPGDEPPGDYYFSLVFLSNSEQLETPEKTNGSIALGGIATNVLLSIGPKSKTTGTIEDFSTSFFQPEGPVAFSVKVKNTSSHFINPKSQIVITNMFGQTIGKVDLLPVNILSNSTRSLPSKEQFVFEAQKQAGQLDEKTIQKLVAKDAGQSGLLAIWPEKFLLGPYTATLTVAFSDEGPLYTRSIVFLGVPIYIIAGFGIAFLLLIAIRTRLKHHQKL